VIAIGFIVSLAFVAGMFSGVCLAAGRTTPKPPGYSERFALWRAGRTIKSTAPTEYVDT
jgi:hypothetical protein